MEERNNKELQEQNTAEQVEKKEWEKPEISVISTNQTKAGPPASNDDGFGGYS